MNSSDLGQRLTRRIGEATLLKSHRIVSTNAEANRPYFGKTIADIPAPAEPEGAAIVIVGGPSLHRKNRIRQILESGFKGDIIAADGSMGYCIRNGLTPHYVVTVDGHPTRMVRWFGDPDLEKRAPDDYFGRQDLDPDFWKDQVRTNRELIEMIDRHGPKMKAVIATSAHLTVTRRCIQAGMDLYWWNPLYDDYEQTGSVTKRLFESNGIPCMVTGGNVGTSAWIFAHSVLKRKHVALLGMDLGYAPGTPLRNTQYYYEICNLLGESRAGEAYIQIHNPHLGETWFTDPTYYWYRQVFLELSAQTDCQTYNCTEGGTLFAEHIPFIPLQKFLDGVGN
ncbi:MAG: hypothetical protein HY399_03715 [Elusimicrobia bacterium]|nr:hypothetical protein [Elusimicrobiota bacterium]